MALAHKVGNKPNTAVMKQMLKSAFNTPDRYPSEPEPIEAIVDEVIEPTIPHKPAPISSQSHASLEEDPIAIASRLLMTPTEQPSVVPANNEIRAPMRGEGDSLRRHEDHFADDFRSRRDYQAALDDADADSDWNDGRAKAGRKRHPEPLKNVTLSMEESTYDRLLELSAYERLRLKRSVDISEIVREILAKGLNSIENNIALPDARPATKRGDRR